MSPGERVTVGNKTGVITRIYGDNACVVFDGEASVLMVPLTLCTRAGLRKVGRNIQKAIQRPPAKTYPKVGPARNLSTDLIRRRGTTRMQRSVRRSTRSGASRDGPPRPSDDEPHDLAAVLPLGSAA